MRTTLALFIGSAAVATGYVAPAAFAPFGTVAKVCHATEPRSIWPSRSLERLVGEVGRHSSASSARCQSLCARPDSELRRNPAGMNLYFISGRVESARPRIAGRSAVPAKLREAATLASSTAGPCVRVLKSG